MHQKQQQQWHTCVAECTNGICDKIFRSVAAIFAASQPARDAPPAAGRRMIFEFAIIKLWWNDRPWGSRPVFVVVVVLVDYGWISLLDQHLKGRSSSMSSSEGELANWIFGVRLGWKYAVFDPVGNGGFREGFRWLCSVCWKTVLAMSFQTFKAE